MTSQVYRNMLRGIHAISWSKQSLWRHISTKICYAASVQSADSNKAYDVTGLLEYVTRHPCNQLIITKPMTSQVYRNMLRGIHAIRSKQSLWRHRSIGICYAASMWKSADQRSPLHPDLYRHDCHSLDTPCHDPDHVRISLPMQYMLTTQTGWRPNADQSGGKLNISVKNKMRQNS